MQRADKEIFPQAVDDIGTDKARRLVGIGEPERDRMPVRGYGRAIRRRRWLRITQPREPEIEQKHDTLPEKLLKNPNWGNLA